MDYAKKPVLNDQDEINANNHIDYARELMTDALVEMRSQIDSLISGDDGRLPLVNTRPIWRYAKTVAIDNLTKELKIAILISDDESADQAIQNIENIRYLDF